ncbi:abc transporter family protein [Pelomyxa schiedti]|nr:abc transporter family protein [Pelomyxa schiedti]
MLDIIGDAENANNVEQPQVESSVVAQELNQIFLESKAGLLLATKIAHIQAQEKDGKSPKPRTNASPSPEGNIQSAQGDEMHSISIEEPCSEIMETSTVVDVEIPSEQGKSKSRVKKCYSQRPSKLHQFFVLCKRELLCTIRNPSVIYIRTAAAIITALLVGIVFWQQEDIGTTTGPRINTMMLLACAFIMFVMPSIDTFCEERDMFLRERASGHFSTAPYWAASLTVEFPVLISVVMAYAGVSYWMVGLDPRFSRFVFFVLLVSCVVCVVFSLAHVAGAWAKNPKVAVAAYVLLVLHALLLGGFFMTRPRLPSETKWSVRTSFMWFTFEALLVNEFEGKPYSQDVYKTFGLCTSKSCKWIDLAILACTFVALRIVVYLLLRFYHSEKR